MRLETENHRAPHARIRERVEPKRTAHVAGLICTANKRAARHGSDSKRGRRNRILEARRAAVKARAEAMAKVVKPAFEPETILGTDPYTYPKSPQSYTGPGSKWHRRMVAAGKK
jgi:hypothetical protein